jgi:cytochrome c nitrite reductase small subunit
LKLQHKLLIGLALLGGFSAGGGAYLAHMSNAISYLSDDPETCINCHVMMPQYTTWKHSSHREYAVCNDCHVPQNNVFDQYLFKAKDGLRHSTLFTLRGENQKQVVKMLDEGRTVVQNNCIRCHEFTNERTTTLETQGGPHVQNHGYGKKCWDCHREVPHGRVKSLSSVPNSKMQLETDKVSPWILQKKWSKSHETK